MCYVLSRVLGLLFKSLSLLPPSLHLVSHEKQQRNLVVRALCECAFCKPSGPHPARLERRSIPDEFGELGLDCVSSHSRFPSSPTPPFPFVCQAQTSLRRKDVGFSAPGGRGPLEACSTTSSGLLSTCLSTTLAVLPKSAARGCPSLSCARYGCGRPGKLRDLPANSTSAGGWGEMESAGNVSIPQPQLTHSLRAAIPPSLPPWLFHPQRLLTPCWRRPLLFPAIK